MSTQRHLLAVLGAAAGGLVAAAVIPMAVAYADDCAAGECTLVFGGSATDVTYSGFRPLFTYWTSDQPVNVEVTPPDGSSFASGSYDVSEQDYNSPIVDTSVYYYGDFTPSATNTTDIDSDGLSGASVYNFVFFPSTPVESPDPQGILDNLEVSYPGGGFTDVSTADGVQNIFESNLTGEADWIYLPGQANPVELFDGFPDPAPLAVPDVLPPDLWF